MNHRISPRLFLGLLAFSPVLTNVACAAPDAVAPVAPAPVAPAPVAAAPDAVAAVDPTTTISIGIADEAAFFNLLDLDLPALAEVKAAVEAKDWTAAKVAWARHLKTRLAPQWLWSRRDKERIIKILDEKDNGLTRFIKPADETLARRFAPQGVVRQLDKNIDWQLELSEETHVMSRMPYWRDLGLAYWQTGDAKYAADFVYILNDWIDDNPVPTNLVVRHNTKWRGLEAGIRADTWWDTMQMFMDAPEFDANAKYRMTKSLVEHARFLYLLQYSFRGGNGQFIENSGLATTGMMLPEFKESAAWRQRALDMFSEHLEKNVAADGAYTEWTPGYHASVQNQFARVAQMYKLNGYQVPELLAPHEKMYDWQLRISMPNRSAPVIGDARGTALGDYLATGALLYNRSDLRYLASPQGPASWVWIFGADAFDKYAAIPAKKPDFGSTMTEESKFLVMRTGWERNDNYLLFNNHPWGGTHSHADRMELVLFAGRELLVDPGILNYNQPLSINYFKKSEAHNIIVVDGKEQPKFDPKVLAWKTTPQADFASSLIEGDGIRQQRSVLFVKPGYWVVVDHVTGADEHEVKRLFHFPVGEAKFTANSAQTAFPTGMNVQVQSADNSKLEQGKGWIVVNSVKADEAPAAIFVSKGQLPMTLVTVLTPFSDAKMLPRVERIAGADSQIAHIKLSFPDGQHDEIAVVAEPMQLKIGAQKGMGRALLVRQGPQSNATTVLDGSISLRP